MSPFVKALVATSAVVLVPVASHAREFTPEAARAYCTHLTSAYTRYAGSPEFAAYFGKDVYGGVAVAECKEGHPEVGIPILEWKLRGADIPIPPPAPPGTS
jgi:hypothetical protein